MLVYLGCVEGTEAEDKLEPLKIYTVATLASELQVIALSIYHRYIEISHRNR